MNIVLSGHKHVPYVWRLENIYLCNAGTVASLRVRGYTKPCYNVLEFEGDEVKISRKFPFGGQTTIAHFSLSSGVQYYRELEVLILIARGASNRQVAQALGISAKTAGTHIERIYIKTGASTRSTATLFAMQNGLLETLEPFDL